MISKFKLSRRTVLRGLAGSALATVALPTLEAMLDNHGEALADGSPLPMRFMTFLFGNGVIPERWDPTTTGTGWELTPQLAPLAAVKSYCSILTGFDNRIPPITHHEGMAGMFSGHPYVNLGGGGFNTRFGGPSIDQVVADTIGTQTTFRSIELGCTRRVSTNEGPTMQFLSHRQTGTTIDPQPPEYNPRALFQRLFNVPPADDPSRPLRVSVLDAVKADVTKLKTKLGAVDRGRLDSHLQAISELQASILAPPPACTYPAEPTEVNDPDVAAEHMRATADAMTDLLVHAFACDLSRVASYMLTGGVGFAIYSDLSQVDEVHNTLSHNFPPAQGGDSGLYEEFHQTILWNMERFADLLTKMMNTPEGTGTLLDNSLVYLSSDHKEGWIHGTHNMPMIVAGGAGGALNRGIHYHSSTGANPSDVLLSICQAAGSPITEIGSAEGYSNTPLTVIRT